jgi:chemotaxis protein MotB
MGRKKQEGGGGAPEWMCTYGDLMSLLLCFFIMLFAISIIADVKYEAFMETLKAKIGYSGMSRSESNNNKPATAPSSTAERNRRTASQVGGQPTEGNAGDYKPIQTIDEQGDRVKGGLIRFEWGSDQLTAEAKKDLEGLYPTLRDSHQKIMVKGYVAPTEEGETYDQGIYLAHARAVNVRDYLVSLGLKKEYLLLSAADATGIPNRAILPKEMDPKIAGSSAAVYVIANMLR